MEMYGLESDHGNNQNYSKYSYRIRSDSLHMTIEKPIALDPEERMRKDKSHSLEKKIVHRKNCNRIDSLERGRTIQQIPGDGQSQDSSATLEYSEYQGMKQK
ncbi:hypothetical protein WA026_003268 [Henosepilachna vigintioctopunctata]|uniref:Uncharacterized protein n=1 Tax=Henosepilachna vigintioctopunctata TaxID=420089 RepID=A0AAW1TIQ5_9CUCU